MRFVQRECLTQGTSTREILHTVAFMSLSENQNEIEARKPLGTSPLLQNPVKPLRTGIKGLEQIFLPLLEARMVKLLKI